MKAGATNPDDTLVWDVTLVQDEARILVARYPDQPDSAAAVFSALTATCIDTDIVIQASSSPDTINLLVVMRESDQARCREVLLHVVAELGGGEVSEPAPIACLYIMGPELTRHDETAERVLATLAAARIEATRMRPTANCFAVVVDRPRAEESERLIRRALGGEGAH